MKIDPSVSKGFADAGAAAGKGMHNVYKTASDMTAKHGPRLAGDAYNGLTHATRTVFDGAAKGIGKVFNTLVDLTGSLVKGTSKIAVGAIGIVAATGAGGGAYDAVKNPDPDKSTAENLGYGAIKGIQDVLAGIEGAVNENPLMYQAYPPASALEYGVYEAPNIAEP